MNETINHIAPGQTIIAVDLGTTSVRAIAAEITAHERLRLLGMETEPCPANTMRYGTVTDTSEVALCVNTCLRKLRNSVKNKMNRDIDISHVFVSLGSRHSTVHAAKVNKKLTNRLVSKDKLNDLQEKVKNDFASKNDEAHIYNITCYRTVLDNSTELSLEDAINSKAENIEMDFFFIVDKENKHKYMERIFLQTGSVRHTAFSKAEALSAAVLTDEDKQNGCAIIDFGAQTTTLIVYHNNRITHLKVVRLGGDNITHDIAEFNIATPMAEAIKQRFIDISGRRKNSRLKVINCNNGQPQHIDTNLLEHVARCRIDEIMEPLLHVINEEADFSGGKVYITGKGSHLQGIDEYLQKHTDMTVEYGNHDAWLAADTAEDFSDPALSMMIGTLACAIEHIKQQQPGDAAKAGKDSKTQKRNTAKGGLTGIFGKVGDWVQKEMDGLFQDADDEPQQRRTK